jgi:hypothetical protein
VTVVDHPRIQAALTLISNALPRAVREVEYFRIRGPLSTTERVFCAFCEIALRGFASVPNADVPVAAQYQAVVAAAADIEDFCSAARHRLVQTAPIAAVVVHAEPVVAADGASLWSVGEERRHEIWRRVGSVPSASMAWNSPSVQDVARVQAELKTVSDLRPGDKEQPWPGEPWSIDRVVDSLRLLGPGPVRALGNWIEFPEHEPFLRRLLVSAP